ncbi:hypothetical protein BC830DRAFT_1127220 [Chytriomyces sp. MP71]|nr:hypothetical protein BC830DRAFT_1127220 [Chytriomyces sp. MP71]
MLFEIAVAAPPGDRRTPPTSPVPATKRPFDRMPPEILDHVLPFVDSDSIVTLCHALPYFKHVSHAIHSAARCLKKKRADVRQFWPSLRLSETIPDECAPYLRALILVLKRNGGTAVTLVPQNIAQLRSFISLLPDNLVVDLSFATNFSEDHLVLEMLAAARVHIRTLDFECNDGDDYVQDAKLDLVCAFLAKLKSVRRVVFPNLPLPVWQALPAVNGLMELDAGSCYDFPHDRVGSSMRLRRVLFGGEAVFEETWWTNFVHCLKSTGIHQFIFTFGTNPQKLQQFWNSYRAFVGAQEEVIAASGWSPRVDEDNCALVWECS